MPFPDLIFPAFGLALFALARLAITLIQRLER